VSGSVLNIDYSEGYNLLVNRTESLANLLKTLTRKNADHEIRISDINNKIIPESLLNKMAKLNDELASERILLDWVRGALAELQEKSAIYESYARVIANKELFPGVTVRLNKKMWKAEKEYRRCRVILENGKWHYDPII